MSPIEHIEKKWPDAEKWGYMGPGWYFWCEDWANCVGPYRTEAEAKEALAKYCVELDKSPTEQHQVAAVKKFLGATGHDLCHENRQELAMAFGLEAKTPALPPEQEFAERCIQYRQQLYGLEGPGSEQERIENLESLVRTLWAMATTSPDIELGQEKTKLLNEALK